MDRVRTDIERLEKRLEGRARGYLETLMSKSVLVCGARWSWKTTTSAALGAEAALRWKCPGANGGPARRLADALDCLKCSRSPHRRTSKPGYRAFISNDADPKRTFDEVIGRHALDSESRERLLHNPFYQEAVARRLSGIYGDGRAVFLSSVASMTWSFWIHPLRASFDFLEAPDRLRGFFESRTFSFMESSSWVGKVTGNSGPSTLRW